MADGDGARGARESPRFPASPRQVGTSRGTTRRSETGQDPSVGPTCPGPALTLVGSGDPSQGCISTQQLLGNTKYVERDREEAAWAGNPGDEVGMGV